jgi:Zn finger protein HypA/HybF involved in hydrogenase expression
MSMNPQKLHYEHIGGCPVVRDGFFSWRCPDCKSEGQSKTVMQTCPHCGNKPNDQPQPETLA